MNNIEKGPQASKSLLEKLKGERPDHNVAFTAVEALKDEREIREFFVQYVLSLNGHVAGDPQEVARQNIGHILAISSKETLNRWKKVLPEVVDYLYS